MTTTRTRITVEDVAADPTNAYQVTVHGDAAIEKLTIHGDENGHGWVYVKYANGGSSSGTPKHWASYVRITEDEPTEDETTAAVRDIYGDAAAELVTQGWTVDSAIAHVEGTCDVTLCSGNHEPTSLSVFAHVIRWTYEDGTTDQHIGSTLYETRDQAESAVERVQSIWQNETRLGLAVDVVEFVTAPF